jgi:hypothetical protein
VDTSIIDEYGTKAGKKETGMVVGEEGEYRRRLKAKHGKTTKKHSKKTMPLCKKAERLKQRGM